MISESKMRKGLLIDRRQFLKAGGIVFSTGFAGNLVACSNADPQFYTLMPYPGQVYSAAKGIVEVRTPSLPLSLDRDRIVEQQANYTLKLDEMASWSEPLNVMIGSVVAQNLRNRLPSTTIFSQNEATTTFPKIYVEVAIDRFAKNAASWVELAGAIAVYNVAFKGGVRNIPVAYTLQPAGTTMSEQVAALSAVLGKMSDRIALEIVNL